MAVFLTIVQDTTYAWHFAYFLYHYDVGYRTSECIADPKDETGTLSVHEDRVWPIFLPCEAIKVLMTSLGVTEIFQEPFENYIPNAMTLKIVKIDMKKSGLVFKKRPIVSYISIMDESEVAFYHNKKYLYMTDMDYLDFRTIVKTNTEIESNIINSDEYAHSFYVFIVNYLVCHVDYGQFSIVPEGARLLLRILRSSNVRAISPDTFEVPLPNERVSRYFLNEMEKLGLAYRLRVRT